MSDGDRQRWNAKYEARTHGGARHHSFFDSMTAVLPRTGRALDVAGGTGRHALWLAKRGLQTTIVDVSDVGLVLAAARAADADEQLSTLRRDLETEGLPAGPWNVVVCVHYLERSMFPQLAAGLAAEGWFVMVHPTVTNLERHHKPSRRFLLLPGELETLVAPHLDVVSCEESWSESGFHEARLVARARPNSVSR